MKRVALAAIRGYQRWLSPHKGFCCALRAGTGGESCSAYGYRVIERFGLLRGLGLLDRRLALCGHVHGSLHSPAPSRPAVPHPWYHKEQGHCDLPCDSPGCDLPHCELPHCGSPCHGSHGGHGGRAGAIYDCLDTAKCGCDIWECDLIERRRRQRRRQRCCDSLGRKRRKQRSTAQLDALARRIRRREQAQRQRRRGEQG